MANYLRKQSAGDVLRNTFTIFGKGFSVIFLSYGLPMLPFAIWQTEALAAHNTGLYYLILLYSLPVNLPATAAITVSVSDICLGNAPSLARSYKKVSAVILKVLGTNILQLVIIYIGFVLIFIPGIIASLWLIFTPSVVILEGLGGFAALKRSKDLAHGYNWRNLGVISVLWIIVFVISAIFGFMVPPDAFLYHVCLPVLNVVSGSIMLTMTVLLYYDLRVRKEAYDAAALAEDLRR